MTLLAIDPGEHTGWALFDSGGRLEACGLCAPAEVEAHAHAVDTLVVEWPRARAYGARIAGGALIQLAAYAGIVIGSVKHKELRKVFPEAWKGTIPKPTKGNAYIIEIRVRRILTAQESLALPAKVRHDVFDAIGLGLFALGRAQRGFT